MLPSWPSECRALVPHYLPTLGDDAVVALKRERQQLDLANGVIGRCARHYTVIKAGLEAPPSQ